MATPEEEALALLAAFIAQYPGAVGLLDAATFKQRYTEFSQVPDATVTVFLAEALMNVDASWPSNYIAKAHGLATAHALKLEGYGSQTTQQNVGLANLEGVTRFKIDDLEVQFSDAAVERANADSMSSTMYGRQFQEIRQRLFGHGVWAR